MPDQTTMTGKDGKIYNVDPAHKITQAELDAAIDQKAKNDAPQSIGSQLLDKTVDALPGIGSIIGGGAGFVGGLPTGPGDVATTLGGAAIGGAGGAYVRDAINQLRGKMPQQSLGQAADSQLGAANDAATSTMLPAILGGFRRPAQTAAQDAYQSISGIGDAKVAGKILDEGRGTLRSSNTAALKAAEDASNVPAVKPRVRSVGMRVEQVTPGRPAIPGPLAGASEAHGTATMRPISPAEKAIPSALGGGIGYAMGGYPGAVVGGAMGASAAPLVRPALSGLAQGAYNAAGQAGPIGELLRQALMSYLSGSK